MSLHRFDDFFDAHYDPVVRSLTLALGNRTWAEEAAQEGFAKALRHWGRVREMQRPVAWIHVVAMNGARRALVREARAVQRDRAPAPAVSADPSAGVATSVTVRTALDTLPPRQRAVVVLRYLADLSVEETAHALRCAPGTVKSTLHAALAALRVELADREEP